MHDQLVIRRSKLSLVACKSSNAESSALGTTIRFSLSMDRGTDGERYGPLSFVSYRASRVIAEPQPTGAPSVSDPCCTYAV